MPNFRLMQRATVACSLLLVGSSATLADDPSLLTAWKRRAEQVKTLEVHWTRKRHLEPGSEAGKNLRTQAADGTLYPPRPLDLETKLGFWLSGDRWRLEWQGEEWFHEAERAITQHRIKVFDGQK